MRRCAAITVISGTATRLRTTRSSVKASIVIGTRSIGAELTRRMPSQNASRSTLPDTALISRELRILTSTRRKTT
jgi:hypothetical protein